MKDTQDVVACVIDHGMFMPVATKIAEKMSKVYYYTPWEKGFADIKDCVLGDGIENIHRLDDFLKSPKFDEIDLFVFPNIQFAGLQERLAAMGKSVWGSRSADELEMMKGKFYETLRESGLVVPEYVPIEGMTALREHLKEHDDLWIKISKYRETMDTWHHSDYAHSEGFLDLLAWKLGPFKDQIVFYVLSPIETNIEGGVDNYCIDGQWPDYAVLGYERKNETYLATVKQFKDVPEVFRTVNDKYGPVLAKYQYRNFFSTEVRVKDGESYFIDPTCRTPSPAGEEQLELYGNMADIIWHGANGVMVQPEIVAEFAGESLIHYCGEKDVWKSLTVPEDVKQWVKLYGCAELDGVSWWPPDKEDVIGCIVGIDDTVQGVVDKIQEVIGALDAPVKIDLSSFPELIEEIQSAQEAGIEFTDKTLPEPESVLG